MIRHIDIKLNAAHPQLPLLEATTFVGSPSAVMIHGVPPSVGAWRINAVRVVATYPDNAAHTVAAVLGAAGTWVATIPATETSGRVAQGLQIIADGTDERGESVTGYVLGIAGLAVYTRDMTIESAAGVKYYIHLLDEQPTEPKEGDAYLDGSALNIYHDGAWTEIGGSAAATLTPIYSDTPTFSEWTFSPQADITLDYFGDPTVDWIASADGWEDYVEVVGPQNATELSFTGWDGIDYTATRTRTDIIGYQLGSQSDKPLQPKGDYAPATNIAKSALAQSVQASLGKADTALQTAPVQSVNSKTGAVTLNASDVGAVSTTGGEMTGQLQINQDISGLPPVPIKETGLLVRLVLRFEDVVSAVYSAGYIVLLDKNNAQVAILYLPTTSGTLALTSDIPSLSGQTFNFATTQGVMDALKTVIEALGGTVTNAPSAAISQGE